MEEEASARRARLKALRDRADADAAVASAPGPSVSSGTTTLANPLADDDASASGRVPHASASRAASTAIPCRNTNTRASPIASSPPTPRAAPPPAPRARGGIQRRDGNRARHPTGLPPHRPHTQRRDPFPPPPNPRGSHRPRLPSVLAAAVSAPSTTARRGVSPAPAAGRRRPGRGVRARRWEGTETRAGERPRGRWGWRRGDGGVLFQIHG